MVESTGRYTGTTVVRSTAEKVLKNHGKNNGTGKFDAFVNKMHGLYKATLLDQDELEKVMEREYQKMYESADPVNESTSLTKSEWVVVNTEGRKTNNAVLVPVQVESAGSPTFKGLAYGERMHEYSTSSVLYHAKSQDDAEKFIESHKGIKVSELSKLNEATGSDLYYVSGKTGDPTLSTSDPGKAVEHWFKICRGAKMMASIHTLKEKNGVDLLKWASQNRDKITAWHKKYNCPYQLEYILHGVDHAATSGRIYGFYEDPRATDAFEGDMISVFSAG